MADAPLELHAILESAERAASDQDFASAERYLRQAAALQEAQLGLEHPDLANTLNNLGIVCERRGKSAEAETCYRRAYAIAKATLPGDDPLVLTSGQNLKDFCAATGQLFEPVVPSPPRVTSSPTPPVTSSPPLPLDSPRRPVLPSSPPPTVPAPQRLRLAPLPLAPTERSDIRSAIPVTTASSPTLLRHRRVTWILVGTALLLAFAIAVAGWLSRSGAVDPVAVQAPASPVETATPRTEPSPPIATSSPAKPAVTGNTAPRPVSKATVSVVETRLCRSLSTTDWRCTPATSPAGPGVFFFYTRVKSGRNTTVQHRWYLNGNLRRTVDLRVGANPGAGYRTYSRNTVAAERRGNWTIELRDAEGALLHEERLIIQ